MNLIEISNKFPTDLDCIQYAEKVRWGKKPVCPYCQSTNIGNRNQDLRLHCKNCNKTFSVTTNTQIHNTKLSIRTWFYAIALITDAKKGMSAMQLQRNLGIHYEAAWNMYQKLRGLMKAENKGIDLLNGVIEMDEKYVGGKPRKPNNYGNLPKKNQQILNEQIKEYKEAGVKFNAGKGNPAKIDFDVKRGRGTKKIPVVGIVERGGNVVAQVMKSLTYENLKTMVKKHVDAEDAVLITDEYKGYNKIHNIIEHIKIYHQKIYSYKGINTNSIESFWAIIERGIIGQYHHVSTKFLPNYVAEFVYKYNNRDDNEYMFDEILKSCLTV
jgi:transposase-like protein